VPRAIRAALSGDELPLTAPGLRRDFVFVADVAEACLEAAVRPAIEGEVINVGSGRQVANEELVAEVERAVGRPLRIAPGTYPAHAADRGCWVADIAKARRLLGWTPRHDLAAGLAETVPWVREHSASGVGDPAVGQG
jgi:nucleoside-diphosphate-sugar epimerase